MQLVERTTNMGDVNKYLDLRAASKTKPGAALAGFGLSLGVGIYSPVVAPVSINYLSLFPTAYQILQTDLGLTYGATPRATGTAPPVMTLSGTLTKDNAVPLWFKCTTGGVIGSGAVFAAYTDGVGTTPIMSGITPAVGTPIAITGASVLSGMAAAWAAGTANVDNVWKATCSAWADQTVNAKNATAASSAAQPIITLGINGKCGLLGAGSQLLTSTVGSLLSLTYQILVVGRITALASGQNAIVSGAPVGSYGGTIYQNDATHFTQYSGTLGNTVAFTALTNQRWYAKYTNTPADVLQIGSTSQTGTSSGPGSSTTRGIFAIPDGTQPANAEIFAVIYAPVGSFTAFDAAINSAGGYGVGAIGV